VRVADPGAFIAIGLRHEVLVESFGLLILHCLKTLDFISACTNGYG
jgi:hypothetical protein